MAESRDRLSRAVDIAAIFAARRQSRSLGIYQDRPEFDMALFGSPRTNAAIRNQTVGVGTITGSGRRKYAPPGSARRGRGRGSNSVLPSWYPRTPLRDITAIVRAIERRGRLGGSDGREFGSPMSQGRMDPDFSEATPVVHLVHGNRIMSSTPTPAFKGSPSTVGKVPKILQHITNQASGDSESLTPQKKLLNSIDTVEKVVMEELQKLKRTPSAKKAATEKRVRTLMSMR
ncbi:protein POLYCHOME [Salix suchowensis]|nr:protein POLYCHOME [Salix suchowensis]